MTGGAGRRLGRAELAAWVVGCTIAAVLTYLYAHRAGDFAGYLQVGELALSGRDIYRDAPANLNTWPPFFSLLCVPLALLARVSLVGTRALWLVANWAVFLLCIRMLRRIVSGIEPDERRAAAAVWLGALLSVRWVLSNFEHLQINIMIFALVLGAMLLHRRGSDGRAGALLGFAAALKVMPVLFVPYLLVRRRWRIAGAAILSTAVFSLAPVLVYGTRTFASQLTGWREQLRAGWSVGKMNLSLFAALDRWLGHGLVPFTSPGFNDLAPSGDPRVALALAACAAVAAVIAVIVFRGRYDAASPAVTAEWSVVLMVASLFGTVAWKAYLVVFLLPMSLFAASWRSAAFAPAFRGRLRALAWLTFALGLLADDDLVGRQFAWRLEMASVPTAMALIVLVMLFWYRWSVREGGVHDAA